MKLGTLLFVPLTIQPRPDGLQPVQDGTIIARSHLNAQHRRDEAEVEAPQVWLLIPWCRVQLEKSGDLRLLRRAGDVRLLYDHHSRVL